MTIPTFFASDLEGVLIPEIWIGVAEKTNIKELFLTTREVADYDQLMQMRIRVLNEHGLTIHDVHEVIATIDPLPGAPEFINWVRQRSQFVIITDSFYEFLTPILPKLGNPTVFAHSLEVNAAGQLTGYRLRLQHGKRQAIDALKGIGFRVMATGDSYNDTAMLAHADRGVFFCPPDNVVSEFPQFSVARNYAQLQSFYEDFLNSR